MTSKEKILGQNLVRWHLGNFCWKDSTVFVLKKMSRTFETTWNLDCRGLLGAKRLVPYEVNWWDNLRQHESLTAKERVCGLCRECGDNLKWLLGVVVRLVPLWRVDRIFWDCKSWHHVPCEKNFLWKRVFWVKSCRHEWEKGWEPSVWSRD